MQSDTAYDVIVVSHDHSATLSACLAAVAGLDPAPDRVLLIDNASVDGCAEIGEENGADVVRETSNTGFAAAVNRGIGLTASPWVLVLNPDCAPRHDFVARLFAAARTAGGRIGCLTGLLLRAGDDDLSETGTVDAAGMVVTSSGRHFDRRAGTGYTDDLDSDAWVFGATGAAAMYRRSALADVAYEDGQVFAESFFAYREDAELAWRLQLRGWSCLYAGRARAAHRRGFQPEGGRGGHLLINRHSVKNRFLLRLHCADLSWHLRSLPLWLIRDLLVLGACLTVETSSLPALGEAWRLRRDALLRRRWVLGRRTVGAGQIQLWFRKRGCVRKIDTP